MIETLRKLAKLPDKQFTLKEGESCSLTKCPFHRNCIGPSPESPDRSGDFFCDIKKLKEIYKRGAKYGRKIRKVRRIEVKEHNKKK